jgi:hypothetical protein
MYWKVENWPFKLSVNPLVPCGLVYEPAMVPTVLRALIPVPPCTPMMALMTNDPLRCSPFAPTTERIKVDLGSRGYDPTALLSP